MSQIAMLDRNTTQVNETPTVIASLVQEPQIGANVDHLTLLDWSRVDTAPATTTATRNGRNRNWPKVDVFDAGMILLVTSSGIAGLIALLHLG